MLVKRGVKHIREERGSLFLQTNASYCSKGNALLIMFIIKDKCVL